MAKELWPGVGSSVRKTVITAKIPTKFTAVINVFDSCIFFANITAGSFAGILSKLW
jgi:hypothetical protein